MPGFDIIRYAAHQEVHVDGRLDLAIICEILAELSKPDDFATLHALWLFGPSMQPPPFHEFDDVVAALGKLYARRPTSGKKVALVAGGPFARSVAEVFLGQAGALPVTMRVFSSQHEARAWLGV